MQRTSRWEKIRSEIICVQLSGTPTLRRAERLYCIESEAIEEMKNEYAVYQEKDEAKEMPGCLYSSF